MIRCWNKYLDALASGNHKDLSVENDWQTQRIHWIMFTIFRLSLSNFGLVSIMPLTSKVRR